MRLNQISALPIVPLPAAKKDEKPAPKPKPPDVEAGITGEQVHAVTRREDRPPGNPWPDDSPPDHIDITI